jgi:hypothetical protein
MMGGDQWDNAEPARDAIQEGPPGPDNIHQGDAPQQDEDDNEDDDAEGSFHDIESEHSSHYHTPEPEPSALKFTVEKLFDMIQNGFHGYPSDEHARKLQ